MSERTLPRGPGESARPVPRGRKGHRKGEERHAALLRSLEEALSKRSIAEISAAEIAAGAGLSPSAFYFYFESKYAALAVAVAGLERPMLEATWAFFDGLRDDEPQTTNSSARQILTLWGQHRHLLQAMVESSASDDRTRALWFGWLERFIDAVADRISREREAGHAPDGPPARELATALILSNERNLYVLHLGDNDPATLEARGRTMTSIWLRAVYLADG